VLMIQVTWEDLELDPSRNTLVHDAPNLRRLSLIECDDGKLRAQSLTDGRQISHGAGNPHTTDRPHGRRVAQAYQTQRVDPAPRQHLSEESVRALACSNDQRAPAMESGKPEQSVAQASRQGGNPPGYQVCFAQVV
jgi:hypothetical protein